jgi:hypothetical protein
MSIRTVRLISALFLFCGSACAGEIREFNVATLERLGNELYHRDQIAARASDLVLQTQPIARSLKMRGWVTELSKDGDVVYWIAETPSGPSLAYTVTFHGSAKPEVQDVRGQPLPPKVAARFKARQTAGEALKGKLYKLAYNFEVLDDPDSSGFLVYALGATKNPGEVVLAGHFRVSVSIDGEKAERVDALSRSLNVVPKQGEDDKKTEALWIIQVVSNKPVETFIYLSKLHQSTILVGPPDRTIWKVENGKMEIVRDKAQAPPLPNR